MVGLCGGSDLGLGGELAAEEYCLRQHESMGSIVEMNNAHPRDHQ